MILATVLAILGGGLAEAGRWTASETSTRWIPGVGDGLPYRPPADVKPHPLQDWSPGLPAQVQVSHDFHLPDRPTRPMTLMLPLVEGEVRLFVNGVETEASAGPHHRYLAQPGRRAAIWEVPVAYLRPGRNRIDLMVVGARNRSVGAPLLLAPNDRPVVLEARLVQLSEWLRTWLPALAAAAAALALAAAASLRGPRPWIGLAAAAAAVGARTLTSDNHLHDRLGPFWPLVDQVALSAILICLGCAFIGPQSPRVRQAIVAGCVLFLLLAGLSLIGIHSGRDGLEAAGLGLPILGLLFLAGTGWQAVREPPRGSLAARVLAGGALAAVGVAATAAVTAGSGLVWGLWTLALEPAYGLSVLALLIGLSALAALLSVRMIVQWIRDRPQMSRTIRDQQRKIEAAALALEQQVRRSAVLEERQRLSRDMHDGIGGQLMSLLARVRSGKVDPEQLEGELTNGLAELRLMVDSLDASDGSLADALAVLRSRVRAQVEAAAMTLDWSQDPALQGIASDPSWTLNLARLIQEAVTNAVRHSGGDRVTVALDLVDGQQLAVLIEDNGKGFDRAQVRPGRGLINLAFRAGQMSGAIQIGRSGSGGGTVVRAVVAVQQAEKQATPPALGHQPSDDIMPS
ncbi:MAG: hypothetical protein K2Y04_13210 [Caulobacteraceae bacterium]|nr:hypothetical protein [Caulobacteraceae bacterium]